VNQAPLPAHLQACCYYGEHFTDRELRILHQIAAGATNDEIGASMSISSHTVAGHLRTMLHRSHTRNRAELVARAYAADIITPGTWPPRLSGRRCLQIPPVPPEVPTPRHPG
jgi:DNA-binding CsgD family transcriptional regulator